MADVREPVDHARTGRRVAALFVLVAVGGLAATVLARTRWWLPPLATEQRAEVDRLIYTTLVVTGIVFVLVHLLLATFAWRSAAREGGRAEHFADHPTLELTYTLSSRRPCWSRSPRWAPWSGAEFKARRLLRRWS